MKRYGIRKLRGGDYDFDDRQFPATDKEDSIKQGKRHAEQLGWDEFQVSYIGKWSFEEDSSEYVCK